MQTAQHWASGPWLVEIAAAGQGHARALGCATNAIALVGVVVRVIGLDRGHSSLTQLAEVGVHRALGSPQKTSRVRPGRDAAGLADRLEAEVRGVDLCSPSDAEFDAIQAALLAHGLLVFRDQQLGHDEQTALARRFGELEALGTQMGTAHPEVIAISNVGPDGGVLTRRDPLMMSLSVNEFWHTDSSFREIPSTVSVFRAEIVPETGAAPGLRA